MSDNEMLKNAVKALEKKYSGNGFVAVDRSWMRLGLLIVLRGERIRHIF